LSKVTCEILIQIHSKNSSKFKFKMGRIKTTMIKNSNTINY